MRDSRAVRRSGWVAGVAGGFLALGIGPGSVPSAHADLEDLISQPIADAVGQAVAAAPETATIPLTMYKATEPLVDVSVGGLGAVPVMLDTGSNGLTLPFSDVPFLSLFQAWDGSGTATYGTGTDSVEFFYAKLPETVDFTTTTGQVISDKTDVDVVLFSWPTSLSSPFWSFQSAWENSGADGVLGISPDAGGPDVGVPPPTAGLPGDLGKGVLIDEPAGYLRFGPAPTDLGPGVTSDGLDGTTLGVQVNDGSIVPVTNSYIDSGGVTGDIPSSVAPNLMAGEQLPLGTKISVYNSDSQLLYSYTTAPAPGAALLYSIDNGPIVDGANGLFVTGYEAFQQGPVYVDYTGGPHGGPTITFYPGAGH